eukprot:SAG11_NODE_1019_length_6159_cov_23.425248_5_plen_999_part_00
MGINVSKSSLQRPNLTAYLVRFAAEHIPDFKCTCIQVNKNVPCKLHVDGNNLGPSYIIGLGDYRHSPEECYGGCVWIEGRGPVDIKNKWVHFDGNIPHATVSPYTGTRYTLVYFTTGNYEKLGHIQKLKIDSGDTKGLCAGGSPINLKRLTEEWGFPYPEPKEIVKLNYGTGKKERLLTGKRFFELWKSEPRLPFIAIPSHERWNENERVCIQKLTLAFLQEQNYPMDMVYVFVAPEQMEKYKPLENSYEGLRVVQGGIGILNQRNGIINYFLDDDKIVEMDDDIKGIIHFPTKATPVFTDFVLESFEKLSPYGTGVWGMCAQDNDFFSGKGGDKFGLYSLVNPVLGYFNDKSVQLTIPNIEDFERVLEYHTRKKPILKRSHYGIQTNYWTNPGGFQQSIEERIRIQEDSIEKLKQKYPEPKLFSVSARKKGPNKGLLDIKLNHHKSTPEKDLVRRGSLNDKDVVSDLALQFEAELLEPKPESDTPMTMEQFAVVLEQRLHDKLSGKPIDPRISGLDLCNLDRRADKTSIFVINEILLMEEEKDLLFKLAIMRCGPNNPEGYRKLMKIIESSSNQGDRLLKKDVLSEKLRGFEGPWGRSYLRALMPSHNRAKLIYSYWEQAGPCWTAIKSRRDSTQTYNAVLKMLGGKAYFTAYQICLDLGYKHKSLYNEDEHVLIGPGCSISEEEIESVKQKLVPLLKMPVTKFTVQGLGCEYRKYLSGKPLYKDTPGNEENLREYQTVYRLSQALLENWDQDYIVDTASAIVYKSDCLTAIKTLPDNHFDLLYTNPPFGITQAKWDVPLPWESLWPEIWRVLKPNGAVVLHSSMPFTHDLTATQRKHYKYHWTWAKNNSTTFMLAKIQPMRMTEEIVVFYRKQCTYNPQMTGDEFHPKRVVKHGGGQEYYGKSPGKSEITAEGGHKGRYPETLLNFPIRKGAGAGTRPADMVDFFIETYSNEGDNVLDITCYDAITGERCLALGRNYVGIDLNPHVENGIEVKELP